MMCSNEAMDAKLFIEFIALIIRNRIYNLLKETMLRLDHAVSKRQKIILSSFGLNADDIKSIAEEIDTLLTNSQSLMDTEPDPDEEEL